ncbi:MAG TPA: putative toxin-antitoxin system toxin component, PIN family [Mucilaginibacter sp.]|jgi:putative PIN family toxin of toxin-antitoxin system
MKTDLFVIDTNILVSAFILPQSVSRKVLNKALKEGRIVISQVIADEFTEVLVRPKFDKYLPLETRLEIIDDFISVIYMVKPTVQITECRDPKDNKFLELACTANARFIISGDKDLLFLNPFRGISIKTATEFLNE